MRLRAILAGLLLLGGAVAADAASIQSPFLTGPSDPSQTNATVNSLVIAINAILSPLTGAGLINGSQPNSGAVATNIISLVPAVSGSPAQIALQQGGDSNASIQIIPDLVGGDIILFSSASSGGNLVFANQSMWVPAQGVTPCPGMTPGGGSTIPFTGIAGQPIITGYWIFADWLNRSHLTPSCF